LAGGGPRRRGAVAGEGLRRELPRAPQVSRRLPRGHRHSRVAEATARPPQRHLRTRRRLARLARREQRARHRGVAAGLELEIGCRFSERKQLHRLAAAGAARAGAECGVERGCV